MEEVKQSGPGKSQIVRLQAGLEYNIIGFENQCLQVLIGQYKKIRAEVTAINWMSDKVKVIHRRGNWLRTLNPFGQIVDISNESTDPGLVGLSHSHHHGQLFVIKSLFIPSEASFYCSKSCFLCASEDIIVSLRSLQVNPAGPYPLLAAVVVNLFGNEFIHCKFPPHSVNNGIFLQAGGPILERFLRPTEAFYINMRNIVAIQDTCVVSGRNFADLAAPSLSLPGIFVKVEGPGIIYFSKCNESHTPTTRKSQNLTTMGLFLHLLITVVSFVTVLLMLSKFVVEIDVREPGPE